MATPIEKLLIEIKADTSKLTASLNKTKQQLGKTEEKSNKLSNSLKTLGGIVATLGFARLMGETIQTIREFEDLEATLRAVTGSAENAALSFELIRAFTSTTTFQIQEVASAFIRLKQAGIVPTSEVLQDFGNLAAGMGRSIEQLAQAAFNATTGEMEMLKQFGVVARLEGNKIRATFDGVTTEMERSGESIVEFLRSIGREQFSDALEQRAKTLSGAISNLKDATSEFMVSIGEGGLREELAKVALEMKEVLMNNRQLATDLGQVLAGAVRLLANTMAFLAENIKLVSATLAFLAGQAVAGVIITMLTGPGGLIALFGKLQKILKKTATTAIILQGATGIGLIKVGAGLLAAGGMIMTMNAMLEDSEEVADEATKSMEELDEELTLGLKPNIKTIDQVGEGIQRLSKAVKAMPKGKFTVFDALTEMGANSDNIVQILQDEQLRVFNEMVDNLGTSSAQKSLLMSVKNMMDMGFFAGLEEALKEGDLTNIQIAFRSNLERALATAGFKKDKIDGIVDNFYATLSKGFEDEVNSGNIKTSAEMIARFFTEAMDQSKMFLQSERDQFYQDLFGPKVTEEFFKNNMAPIIGIPNIESAVAGIDKESRLDLLPKTLKELKDVVGDPDAFAGLVAFGESMDMFIGLTDDQVLAGLKAYIANLERAEELNPFAGLEGMEAFIAGQLKEAVQGTEALKEAFVDLSETEIDAFLTDLSAVLEKLGIDADRAKEILDELKTSMENTSGTFSDELAVAVQQASMAFTRDFVDGLEEAGDAMDAFESLAANIVKQIIAIFLQLAIVNKIINSIFGTQYQQMDIMGDNAFQVYTPPKQTASGGRISGPRMVGERGPELFVPDATGLIKSGHDTRSMLKGGQPINVYQNVNFATGVVPTVRAEVVKMLPQIAEVSKTAVAEASGRGGSYRRTLLGG